MGLQNYMVCGGGGPHAIFGAHLARALAGLLHEEVAFAHVSTLEQLREAVRRRAGEALVCYFEPPDERIVELLSKIRRPIVVFHDRFATAAAFLMEHHGADFRSALRYTSLTTASLVPLVNCAEAVHVLPPTAGESLADRVRTLCSAFGVEPMVDPVPQMVHRLGLLPGDEALDVETALRSYLPASARTAHRLDTLPDFELRLLTEIAPGYDALGKSRPSRMPSFYWPPEFCMSADLSDHYVRNPIEMSGPARLVSYGPYLNLPVGAWTLEALVGVADNLSGNRLRIAVTAGGRTLAEQEFELPAQGMARSHLPFATTSARDAIEIYVRVTEGAIEGRLTLRSFRIAPQDDEPDQAVAQREHAGPVEERTTFSNA